MASRIPSIVIPAYGVYKSQEEIAVLSTVLERHMNKTTIALSAMQPELTDIRGMVLQNRMALDLILASQGGVCKVLGWECCSYISDASSAVHDVVADTERGIQELHEDHDWNPFGEMQSWTGSWGASLVKVLAWVVGVLILIMIVIALMVFISRACVKKAVTALVSSPDPGLLDMTLLPDWIPPYAESDGLSSLTLGDEDGIGRVIWTPPDGQTGQTKLPLRLPSCGDRFADPIQRTTTCSSPAPFEAGRLGAH
ncbi:endogenous retrovirus group PABLB member 1 Env polyprotein-like [Xiphias gladius]|uniref:endogenous retrovirus group PABLB member 1 Env polyprotein-like n=1 Tax=Xiphias gladius TaxID=8245 RepID=UPI001A98F0E7|nr:endogenous retrovirus group PABLB member 1 Env polyprotein-like [Xiphias gladius]